MYNRPQALFLGNGINRSFNGDAWNDLLERICTRQDVDVKKLTSPMPLRAILVTNNQVQSAVKTHAQELYGQVGTDEQREILRQLLTVGFDHILTTNYSYELEMVGEDKSTITDQKLKQMMHSYTKPADNKYLIQTYNEVVCKGISNKIWHIHGEARKPSSIILGHYQYGSLLHRMREYISKRQNTYQWEQNRDKIEIKSWLDAFIMGDVYVLGFGYDLSEFDLWWLLDRKDRENAKTGKVYFFTPEPYEVDEKLMLLDAFQCVELVHCGIQLPPKPANTITEAEKKRYDRQCDETYREFYPLALEKIKKITEGMRAWQNL